MGPYSTHYRPVSSHTTPYDATPSPPPSRTATPLRLEYSQASPPRSASSHGYAPTLHSLVGYSRASPPRTASPHRYAPTRSPSPQATGMVYSPPSESPMGIPLPLSGESLTALTPPRPQPLYSVASSSTHSVRASTPSQAREHHGDYYLHDGVVFAAGDILFKVPRYMFLQESITFPAIYEFPMKETDPGTTDSLPIVLEAEAIDLERLLTILYPKSVSGHTGVTGVWGEAEWQSILHIATMWNMSNIRALAIDRLSSIASPLTKTTLGRRYEHAQWIRDGFLELCLRDEPLTEEEGAHFGWKDIVKLASAREQIRSQVVAVSYDHTWADTRYGQCLVYQKHYSTDAYRKHKMVHAILDQVFGLEDLHSESEFGSRPNTPNFSVP
ncbi:hypothetical protein K439DRAFT_105623 [Ramaria rubella]|nr:hypothetical protein K439DRAFT_105623 [Ramaria rubella]